MKTADDRGGVDEVTEADAAGDVLIEQVYLDADS